ncbi:uncharacterized protein CMU_008200 [Cryptosporidium muris RN66]|uniref:Uncharacterized protein n=1 Tax=Cryptosporidium muris (strain RN66) TaxID=441375 RepID=B6ADN8_CRYMR|nr:uncharacterized protein CMU_008200 [Cryptosporidium muris RN66]EEA06329.1 hypothetical protein, conserved [Cryptosporidium muris RN66]|eukprot:XP_002140678.1 hypothetical protein [Cryptosporidium muris RN66]
MPTPIEKKLGGQITFDCNNVRDNGTSKKLSSTPKAFGLPPRFSDSVTIGTVDGHKLLVAAKVPNNVILHKTASIANSSENKKKSYNKLNYPKNNELSHNRHLIKLNKTPKSVKFGKESDSLVTNTKVEEINSIFCSVNKDLEELSRQMSIHIPLDTTNRASEDKDINLTSLDFQQSSNSDNVYSKNKSKGSANLNLLEVSSISSPGTSSEISLNSEMENFSSDSNVSSSTHDRSVTSQSTSKYNKKFPQLIKSQTNIMGELIHKLSNSISVLKDMILGRDDFVHIIRDQISQSDSEVLTLSKQIEKMQRDLELEICEKNKYKSSMKKLLVGIQEGNVHGSLRNYLVEIQSMKIQEERLRSNLSESELTIIKLQQENKNLNDEKLKDKETIEKQVDKIHRLNLVVNQITQEKLELIESKEYLNGKIDELYETIKCRDDENMIAFEEVKRSSELNGVLQDHVMLLKAQLEIEAEDRLTTEKKAKESLNEVDTLKEKIKSLEHRESILMSALEDSSYRMTDIDKALETQKREYEAIISKENKKYNKLLHAYKLQTEKLTEIEEKLSQKIKSEEELIKWNNELQERFGSFENHIRRLLDARDNEIIQLNDYMDKQLKKKDEEVNIKIQELCRVQQNREKKLINQILDQHDGFEKQRIQLEYEIHEIKDIYTKKLDDARKLESEKQTRLVESLANKEHEILVKEHLIHEIDSKKSEIEKELCNVKQRLQELQDEKNATVEKLLALQEWGIIIESTHEMDPQLQLSLNTRLEELRQKVNHLEQQEVYLANRIEHQNLVNQEDNMQ